jgi:hypothetical protein
MLSDCVLWKFFGSRKESFFPLRNFASFARPFFTCLERQNKFRKTKPFVVLRIILK